MSVGQRIRDLRKLKALSLEELAERARVKVDTLRNIERGLTEEPRMNTLRKIADALCEDIDSLLSKSKRPDDLKDHHQLALHAQPWPKAIYWCNNTPLAALCCAKLMLEKLKNTSRPAVVFPTGRTASELFHALSIYFDKSLLEDLFRSEMFIDTETYGVSKSHPASRHGFVLSALQNLTVLHGIPLCPEKLHFFEGTFQHLEQPLDYDKLFRMHKTTVQVLALSPYGEFIGYESGTSRNLEDIRYQKCCILHLTEASRSYIEPHQPSTAIISMGLNHVLQSEELLVLVTHNDKAEALKRLIDGPMSPSLPSTLLRLHPNVKIISTIDIARILEVVPPHHFKSEQEILHYQFA